MRTENLQPIRPGQLFPNRNDVNEILRWLNSTGAGGGAGIRNTPMGLSSPPQTPTWIYAEITENDDPDLLGLHGFQQIEFVQLDNGEWTTGTTGVYGTVSVNPLKELNSRQIPVGEVVRAELGPGDMCWVTCWQGDDTGSGSGDGTEYTTTCSNGTIFKVRISGTTITVTET